MCNKTCPKDFESLVISKTKNKYQLIKGKMYTALIL